MNPVVTLVARELRGASRRPATWRSRLAVAAMSISGALVVLMASGAAMSGPGGVGSQLFGQLTAAAGLSALALGVLLTSDAISRERREGTLGLLFLTDLSGWDVVLGKAGAAVFSSAYALMSILPVLAIGILLGGVTLSQVGLLAVALLNALFLSLAASMWISTWCTASRQAAGLAGLTVFALASIPLGAMVWISMDSNWNGLPMAAVMASSVSPAVPLALAAAAPGMLFPVASMPAGALPISMQVWFWCSLGVQQLVAWGLLAWAARRTRTVWQDAPARRITVEMQAIARHWTHGGAEARRRLRVRLLEKHPFLWLSQREIWKPYHPWILLVAVGLVLSWQAVASGLQWRLEEWVQPAALLAQGFMGIWIVTEAALRLVEERQIGAFELLLCTPLDRDAILQGQAMALRRMFLFPLILLIGVDLWLVMGPRGPGWVLLPPDVPGLVQCFLIRFLVAIPATRWVATRLALQGQTIHSLGVRTLVQVWFAPAALGHLFGWICEFLRQGFSVGGLLPVEAWGSVMIFSAMAWIAGYRAKQTVLRDFRTLATQTRRSGSVQDPAEPQGSGISRSQTTGR